MSTNTNKKSERNYLLNNKSRNIVFKMIKEKMNDVQNEEYPKNKIIITLSIYNLVLDNFNLLFIEYISGYYLYNIVFNKALEIKESIISEIEKGYKFKHFNKCMEKIIILLKKKYLDNIFDKLLKKTIYNKDNKDNKNNCAICLDHLTNNVFETTCNHKYHKKCLYRHLLNSLSCPLCRNCMHF